MSRSKRLSEVLKVAVQCFWDPRETVEEDRNTEDIPLSLPAIQTVVACLSEANCGYPCSSEGQLFHAMIMNDYYSLKVTASSVFHSF